MKINNIKANEIEDEIKINIKYIKYTDPFLATDFEKLKESRNVRPLFLLLKKIT